MTRPDMQDDALDRQIRAAAEVPFDDIATTEAVLARVHRTRATTAAARRQGWFAWFGPAAFASVLAATPFVVAYYPASEDDLLAGLAMGDPRVILSGIGIAGGRGLSE